MPPETKPLTAGTLFALTFSIAYGCSGSAHPSTVKVVGTLTFNGTPVAGASVIFAPVAGGRPATATTDAQGRYELSTFGDKDGAAPGEYKVTVQKTKIEGSSQMTDEDRYDLMKQGNPVPEPKMTSLLPEKYANSASSDLNATVRQSGNDIPLTLKD